MTIDKDLNKNIELLKTTFKDCDDVVFRNFFIGKDGEIALLFVYIDGLIDKPLLSEYVIQSLSDEKDIEKPIGKNLKSNVLKIIANEDISLSEIKEKSEMETVIDDILSGETALLIDGLDTAIILSTRGWKSRSVDEPETETVVRGPREGFVETLRTNTSLVRRRVKDPRLKIKMKKVGERSNTSVAIMYIEDIVQEELLEEVNRRIDDINIDVILDSTMLENLIEDNYLSPFPQIENTERPDSVAASLCEGRVALIVDNSPFALIVPATIGTLMQSSEDYYSRWTITSTIRIIRYIAAFIALLAPALYIAITSFHPGLLPTRLAYYVAASRVNVPFPAYLEAFLMELTIELLREAGTRMAGPIGTTIGIVGGLIIGQAAVDAGIVSPLMIIIVAVTTIASFTLPSYDLAEGLRLNRFILMAYAGVLGLYGIMIGFMIMLTHIVKLNSFGVPFTSPYSGLGLEEGDLKDTIVKAPIQDLKRRPAFTFPKNKRRFR